MQNKITKLALGLTAGFILASCGNYIAPPEKTTVEEELQLEYDRCMKINKNRNCAQLAYDVVRVVKGLEPKPVPKGIVIILRGDGGHGDSDKEPEGK